MKKLSIILGIVFAVALTSCEKEDKGDIQVITSEEMQTLLELEDVQFVDVRSEEERKKSGYIEGSQNIDFNSPTFDEDINKLDKSKPVILYCKTGGRSAKCAQKLKDAGFVKIYDLKGGITQWQFQGFKVETYQ
uniref:rhodanese-like domain-containing protein n=1 Tax=Gelidibacter sp. TaxID=2018083 RepID=UPI0040492D15